MSSLEFCARLIGKRLQINHTIPLLRLEGFSQFVSGLTLGAERPGLLLANCTAASTPLLSHETIDRLKLNAVDRLV